MTRVTKAIYEMTLGGESTGGDLVVARSPLVASLLVASLPGGEVTINRAVACSSLPSKGWPRPFDKGDRLIEVKITVIKGSNFRDFDNWPLNRGWPLNTGSTVFWMAHELHSNFFDLKSATKECQKSLNSAQTLWLHSTGFIKSQTLQQRGLMH